MNNQIRGNIFTIFVVVVALVIGVLVFRIPGILTYSAHIQLIAALLSSFGVIYQLSLNRRQLDLNKEQLDLNKEQLFLTKTMQRESVADRAKAPRTETRFQNAQDEDGMPTTMLTIMRDGGEKNIYFTYRNVGDAEARHLSVDLFAICPRERDVTLEVEGLTELKRTEAAARVEWPEERDLQANMEQQFVFSGRIDKEIPAYRGEIRSKITIKARKLSASREFILAFQTSAPNELADSATRFDKIKIVVSPE